ncbi:unnamed protein product [Sphagnum jensenii]|uniref:Phosphoglycerate kinase n=1 Tax=Sphagnum jensenii TaxID=128206 RepID=A0ABP1B7L3_9BRYO
MVKKKSVGDRMVRKKSVGDLSEVELKGKHVFVHADLNVLLDDKLVITNDMHIRAAVPTIKYLIKNGAKVILSSRLVVKVDDLIGLEMEEKVAALLNGSVLLLENLRFYKEEEKIQNMPISWLQMRTFM